MEQRVCGNGKQMRGTHCPKLNLGLFSLLGLWFAVHTLFPLIVPLVGNYWSWMVILFGVCGVACSVNEVHKKSSCPFANFPAWFWAMFGAVGVWFLLGDIAILSTYGLNLLHVLTFLAPLGILVMRCCSLCIQKSSVNVTGTSGPKNF